MRTALILAGALAFASPSPGWMMEGSE